MLESFVLFMVDSELKIMKFLNFIKIFTAINFYRKIPRNISSLVSKCFLAGDSAACDDNVYVYQDIVMMISNMMI